MRQEKQKSLIKKETSNRKYIKPSLFQFPSNLHQTNGFSRPNNSVYPFQIHQTNTPDHQVRMQMLKPKPMPTAIKFQNNPSRNSAKIMKVRQNGIQEPLIIKITSNRGQQNKSQMIPQQDDQSFCQLSELDNFDELISQIQEKIKQNCTNIEMLANEICQLEALDFRGMPNLNQLILLMMHQSLKQNIYTDQIQGVILTITEEIFLRDDFEHEILAEVVNYYSLAKVQNFKMITQFLKRIGQIVCYIKSEKLMHLASLVSIHLMILWTKTNDQMDINVEQLALGVNMILRSRETRIQLPKLPFSLEPSSKVQRVIYQQLKGFKLTFN